MYELVEVSRLNRREEKTLRRFNEHAEAKEEAERRRRENPLCFYQVYIHLATFCRLVCYETL